MYNGHNSRLIGCVPLSPVLAIPQDMCLRFFWQFGALSSADLFISMFPFRVITPSFSLLLRKFSVKIAQKLGHCAIFLFGRVGGGAYDSVYQSQENLCSLAQKYKRNTTNWIKESCCVYMTLLTSYIKLL